MLGRRTGSSPSERAAFLPTGRRTLSLEAGFQPDPASSHPAIQSVNPAHPAAGCLGRGWIGRRAPGWVMYMGTGSSLGEAGGQREVWQERLLVSTTQIEDSRRLRAARCELIGATARPPAGRHVARARRGARREQLSAPDAHSLSSYHEARQAVAAQAQQQTTGCSSHSTADE